MPSCLFFFLECIANGITRGQILVLIDTINMQRAVFEHLGRGFCSKSQIACVGGIGEMEGIGGIAVKRNRIVSFQVNRQVRQPADDAMFQVCIVQRQRRAGSIVRN